MRHSSIESLEPRWAPARLVGGPLPAQFGATLEPVSAEGDQDLVSSDVGFVTEITPVSGGQFNHILVPVDWETSSGLVFTGAGTLDLSGSNYSGTISGGSLSLGGATLSVGWNTYLNPNALTISGGTLTIWSGSGGVVSVSSSNLTFIGVASRFVGGGELPENVLLQLDVAGPTIPSPGYLLGTGSGVVTP